MTEVSDSEVRYEEQQVKDAEPDAECETAEFSIEQPKPSQEGKATNDQEKTTGMHKY